MAAKIGQRIPFKVVYVDADGVETQELEVMPTFALDDPSLGDLEMVDAFSGFYVPKKGGKFKISAHAKDGGIDLLAEGEDVVGAKDAVTAKLVFGAPEDIPVKA